MEVHGKQTVAKERRLHRELEKWRKRLRLTEWEVMWDAVDRDAIPKFGAELHADSDYRKATVLVADWREPDGLEFLARHEMLHLALNGLRELAMELTAEYSPEAKAIHESRWRALEEHAVTRLGRAFDEFEHIGNDGEHYV